VIISDIEMPRLDGLAFLRQVQPYVENVTPFMILTAYDEWKYAMAAIRLGACNFLQKNPFDLAEISNAVERALDIRQGYQLRLNYLDQLKAELRAKESELEKTYDGTVIGLAAMMEGKDTSTMQHLFRVRDYCMLIGQEVGLPDRVMRDLRLGAMLHDVGKYAIPDAILTKPGPLTDEEWVEMRKHPDLGASFVKRIPFLVGATDVIQSHHERYGGGGYPQGLVGEEIPLTARIFCAVDAYDAITSERCYKAGQPTSVALGELRRCTGTQFDPDVVDAFERALPRIEACRKGFARRLEVEMKALGFGQIEDRGLIRQRLQRRA